MPELRPLDAPLRWGVLSPALITQKVLQGAARSRAADVVAIASRDLGRAQDAATRWRIPHAYGSYDELLLDDDVEAVYVPLPNGLHHPWTVRALEAGKHVLCEKPYSSHPDEVAEAFDLAERRGLVLSEAFMFRYNPQIEALRRMVVEERLIGDLRLVASAFTWPTDAPGAVRLDPALDGGSLLDVGVYCISAARLLAGEPTSVTAQDVTGPTGVDVSFTATMRFDEQVLGHFDCGFHLPDRSSLEVVGTRGVLRLDDPWHCYRPGITYTEADGTQREIAVPVADSYQLQLDAFSRAVRRGEPSVLGSADALGQARTLEALRRSARTGVTTDVVR